MVRLAPRYVAWHAVDECRDLTAWRIKVRALFHGSSTRGYLTGANSCAERCPKFGVGPARQLAVNPHGTVAWIAQDAGALTPTFVVWRVRRGDSAKRLARGVDISPTDLKLTEGGRVFWQELGSEHRG
jgi:hypothetical protein